MALMCERYNGEIERYHVDVPIDVLDKQMKDYILYVDRLVKNETNLSNLVDSAVEALKRTEAENDDEYGDNLFADVESEVELSDEDYEEYYDFIETEKEVDNKNGS